MQPRERAAHQYVEVGWRVFPCAPGTKVPAISSAHPRPERGAQRCVGECGREGHGLHDAVADHRTIARWWREMPRANVGIATGAPGPDVLDVDHKPEGSGFASLGKLVRADLVPPSLAKIRTPSGGAHLYFEGSAQGNGSLAKSRIDYRGLGGYVVAPPSEVNGRAYEVVEHGGQNEKCDWAAIRECLEPTPERPASQGRPRGADADGLIRYVADCTTGVNAKLYWAACRALEQGRDDLLPALIDAAYEAGEDRPGQAERTVHSAMRAPARPFAREPSREAEAG